MNFSKKGKYTGLKCDNWIEFDWNKINVYWKYDPFQKRKMHRARAKRELKVRAKTVMGWTFELWRWASWTFEHIWTLEMNKLNIQIFELSENGPVEHLNIWTFEHEIIWTFKCSLRRWSHWTFEHWNIQTVTQKIIKLINLEKTRLTIGVLTSFHRSSAFKDMLPCAQQILVQRIDTIEGKFLQLWPAVQNAPRSVQDHIQWEWEKEVLIKVIRKHQMPIICQKNYHPDQPTDIQPII